MKTVKRLIDVQFDALHKKERDGVTLTIGEEGDGKSHFMMHVLEYWVTKKYGEVLKDHIKFINLDIEAWAESFSRAESGDICILDEAGEISGRRTMSKLNVAISRAYQIIRADCLNSFLILPDLFWLEGTFTKRRAKGLFYVYARGKVAYWNRDQLRQIMDINSRRTVKSIWVVPPLFLDRFPIYKGILKPEYDAKKKEFMKDTRKELLKTIKEIKGEEKVNPRDVLIAKIKSKLGATKTSELVGLSVRQINRIENKIQS